MKYDGWELGLLLSTGHILGPLFASIEIMNQRSRDEDSLCKKFHQISVTCSYQHSFHSILSYDLTLRKLNNILKDCTLCMCI